MQNTQISKLRLTLEMWSVCACIMPQVRLLITCSMIWEEPYLQVLLQSHLSVIGKPHFITPHNQLLTLNPEPYIYVFPAKSSTNLIMMKYRNYIKIKKNKCSVYQPLLLCMIIPRRTK